MTGFKGKAIFLISIVTIFLLLFCLGFIGCGGGGGGGGDGGDPEPTYGLDYDTTYYWQVESCSNSGEASEGSVWSFTTEPYGYYSDKSGGGSIPPDTAKKIALSHIKRAKSRPGIMGKYGKFLSKMPKDPVGTPKEIADSKTGKTLAYIFELNPQGYIVVPSNTALPPVIAYSFKSRFSWKKVPQNILLSMLAKDLELRFEAIEKGVYDKKVIARNITLHQQYLDGKLPVSKTEKDIMGPLFTFPTWHQESPYNDNCPIDPQTDQRSVVGCVATSISQIMNYWQSPTSVSLTSADNYVTETLGIEVDATMASFSNINYAGGYPDDLTKAAICFAPGVLVQMDYTSDTSGAYADSIVPALTERLGFSSSKYNDSFPKENVIEDIKNGYPGILAVYGLLGGHALNVDGYDDTEDTFHLNFGWDGDTDGWYSLPDGLPIPFLMVVGTAYNITTSGTPPTPTPTYTPGPQTPSDPYPGDSDYDVSVNSILYWSPCEGADYYNIYLWRQDQSKPTFPTASGLTKPQYSP